MGRFPILMYHRIASETCPLPLGRGAEARYAVPLEEFKWQLECLYSLGYRALSVGGVMNAVGRGEEVPRDGVVMTFDDGNRSDFVHALPLLRERGASATFFINASRIGTEDGLEEGMIRDIAMGGMEIGSHGMTHRFLSTLGEEEEAGECERSKRVLSEISGCEIRYFAPPGGRYGRRTLRLLKHLSYEAICTSDYGYNSSAFPPFVLKRIPVTRGTSRKTYRGIVERSIIRLLPGYLRAESARLLRRSLGEDTYGKIRTIGGRE